ncbi:hypothetical protein [Nonomuraea sediminis]|uniref:hypothetical protein n=1 Tax=Nonomuraea sediminis TaxID=2835864 RepID=UPI001BDBDB18|nr:hypothetical protein [Nonomuraea sediminis]
MTLQGRLTWVFRFFLRAADIVIDDEHAAVDDGQAALDHLLERLAGVPTPSGPTPRELGGRLATTLPIVESAKICPYFWATSAVVR